MTRIRRHFLAFLALSVPFFAMCAQKAWTLTEYIGPGSLGDFVSMAMAPTNANFLLAGADVGGIYLSADGGASWKNVTRNLPALGVYSIAFSETTVGGSHTLQAVIGTESGIFRSNSISLPMLGCGATSTCTAINFWTRSSGLDPLTLDMAKYGAMKDLNGGQTFVGPVSVITVDPNNQNFLWAGTGRLGSYDLARHSSIGDGVQVQRFERWKVYRSSDRGATWIPLLRLSPESSDIPYFDTGTATAPGDSNTSTSVNSVPNDDAQVFGIQVQPGNSNTVFVSTDRGFYKGVLSFQGLTPVWTWTETGTEQRRHTTTKGLTWVDDSASPGCLDWPGSPLTTAWCLPIVDTAWVRYLVSDTGEISDYLGPGGGWATDALHMETHPDLRGLAYSSVQANAEANPVMRLYVAVWDIGHDDGLAHTDTDDEVGLDTGLDSYRGGIYYSDDLGETWKWMFTSNGAPTGTLLFDPVASDNFSYRYDDLAPLRASNNAFLEFPALSAIPAYTLGSGTGAPDQYVLAAGAYGKSPGFYLYTAPPNAHWTWYSNEPIGLVHWANYEGHTPENLKEEEEAPSKGPAAGKLLVKWESSATTHPTAYLFSDPRGILKATWTPSLIRYQFDHLGDNDVGTATFTSGTHGDLWASTGLDDACVFAAAETTNYTFVGVSDAGLLRANSSLEYENVASLIWQSDTCTSTVSDCTHEYDEDETRAIATECGDDCTIYAASYHEGGGERSIFMSTDEGDTWTVIGGNGYSPSGWNGLGLSSASRPPEITELQVVPNGEALGYAYVLLAGGSDGLWGYHYDTGSAAYTWEELCSTTSLGGGTGLSGATVSDIALDLDLLPDYAYVTISSFTQDSLIAVDLVAGDCTSLDTSSLALPIQTATSVGIALPQESSQEGGSACTTEGDSAILVVGGKDTDTTSGHQNYDALYVGTVSSSSPTTVSSWTQAYNLSTYGGSCPSGLDATLWDRAARKFQFVDIAVDPIDKCDVWAGMGNGPSFDYDNAGELLERDMSGSTYLFSGVDRNGLALPNGNVKSLSFNDYGQLFVGTCSSLHRVTF